ncbi:unnamed protein product, partial [marine sediment metagenome]
MKKGIEVAVYIAGALASIDRDMEIANGGTIGFPVEVARQVKAIKPEVEVVGYVPFNDREEWEMYKEMGVAPFDLYDRIVYSESEEGIKLRALRRIKRKIDIHIIYYDTKKIRNSMKKTKDYLGIGKGFHYRFLNIHYFSPFMIIVFGDKVLLASWHKTPSGILIKSSEIAETNKRYILSLWKI